MDTKDKNSLLKKDLITKLQGRMAVASFAAGIIISCVSLFIIPPPGEMSTSAISIVSELLVLSGALLGVTLSVDAKMQRFFAKVKEELEENKKDES